jgi:CheY-like chemotaxis protein
MNTIAMTILLVEDHKDTREAMRTYLELIGHSVVEAHDVKSALAAPVDSFDVLICDVGLPDGDGWSLLQMLSKKRPIPAIAISGYSLPSDLARSKSVGFLDHLIKPGDPKELDAALVKMAAHHSKQESSGRKRKGRPRRAGNGKNGSGPGDSQRAR